MYGSVAGSTTIVGCNLYYTVCTFERKWQPAKEIKLATLLNVNLRMLKKHLAPTISGGATFPRGWNFQVAAEHLFQEWKIGTKDAIIFSGFEGQRTCVCMSFAATRCNAAFAVLSARLSWPMPGAPHKHNSSCDDFFLRGPCNKCVARCAT